MQAARTEDKPIYQLRRSNQVARAVLRPIFRGLFHLISDVRILGKLNVPKDGPYLIAMNHVSIYDPPFMIAFWPVCPEAVGAYEIWSKPGQSTLARLYGGIPVHRGQYDRQLIEAILGVILTGRPLLIAPEGGRSHQPGLQHAKPGIGYILERARDSLNIDVPIIPVGISGTTDDFIQRAIQGKRPALVMNIGQAFQINPHKASGAARRVARQQYADQIMLKIAGLLPPEYQGVYANGIQK